MSPVRISETIQQVDSAMDELPRITSRSNDQDIERPDDLARDSLPTIRRWQAPAESSPAGREQAGDGVDPLKGAVAGDEQGLRAETGHCRRDDPMSLESARATNPPS